MAACCLRTMIGSRSGRIADSNPLFLRLSCRFQVAASRAKALLFRLCPVKPRSIRSLCKIFRNFQSPVHVEVSMGSFPNYRHPRLWRCDVISQRARPSSLTHVKKLAATIVMLGFVFWLWFGVSTYHAPRASYPYYDTQKPVPPWSEPMSLEGNYHRGEEPE